VLASTPAIAHIGSRFLAGGAPGYGEAAPGDHLQTAYHLWLFGDQIENGRYPWRDPYQFRPESKPTVNPAVWPYGLVFWPLYHVFSFVLAWNLFVLFTFVAAGLCALAWLRELGLPRGPALVGALAFEIGPYRAVQSAGHLLGPITVLLPLSLWALERGRRGNPLWLLLSAGAIASVPLSGQVHLAIGAVPFYGAYALVRMTATGTRRLAVYLGGAALGVVLSIGAGILIDREVVQGSINSHGRSLSSVSAYSADWLDFVTRHERHGSESFVFLGWVTPLAALVGLYVLVRTGRSLLAALLAVGAVVPMLLALGTNTPLYRPVHAVVPGLQYPRVPERIMPVACLALAALAAFALQLVFDGRVSIGHVRGLTPDMAWVAVAVTAVAVVVVGADLHFQALKASAADSGNKAYAALKTVPLHPRLVELPVFTPDIDLGSVYMYYDTGPRLERLAGYSTTAPEIADTVTRRLQPLNCGDWSSRPGRILASNGAREIAFHAGLYSSVNKAREWFAWRGLTSHGFRPWMSDGAITMFDRRHPGKAPPPPVHEPSRSALHYCLGWYPNDGNGRAMSSTRASLWAYGPGPVHLIVRSAMPVPVTFAVDGRTKFERAIHPLEDVKVDLLTPGWHLVTFATPSLPVVAGRREGARLIAYVLG